jgi:Spy/CpxP family protein refolding chaperone
MMKAQNKDGLGRWGVIGAAAALALALGTGAMAEPGGEDHHGGMEFNPRMIRELNLAPNQEKQLKEAKLAMQKKKIQLHGEKAVIELDLKNVLSTYPVNKAEAMKLAEKIADVDRKMTLLRVEAMTQLLSGLTAEQHAKLMDIQAEWQEKRKAWREEMDKDGRGHRDHGDQKDGMPGKNGGD